MDQQATVGGAASKSSKKLIIGIIVIIIIAGGAYFGYTQMGAGTPSAEQATADNAALLQSVGKLMLVPDEQPIIATINQADVLVKEQAFYAGSQNGDKLIIFPKTQKAIIYSPSRNVIVNSGPFVINSGAQGGAKPSAPAAPAAPTTKK